MVSLVQHLKLVELYDGYAFRSYRRDAWPTELSGRGVSQFRLQGSVRVSLDCLNESLRPLRSCHGDVDTFPGWRHGCRKSPEAGLAYQQTGPGCCGLRPRPV